MSAGERPASRRRPMRRVGDVLGEMAAELGIDKELRFARQVAGWQRLIEELVPAATGSSQLLAIQPPALVVSAATPMVAQELRLRQAPLLAAFARLPEGAHLLELRVVVRPPKPALDPGAGGPPTRR
jgi:hypothetical protein